MQQTNQQWILSSRPKGTLSTDNFELKQSPMPTPDLAAGEVLVKNLYVAFDAAMRGWMSAKPSYMPAVELGDPMRSFNVAQVIESENSELPVGSLVQGMYNWQEFAVVSPSDPMPYRKLGGGITPEMALGVLGGSSATAYWGLLDVGQPQPGETVVVSGAAGATGSIAAQIARIKGCRVIGIAGGAEKCQWLLDECKLEAAINSIANYGRIVLCGAISISNSKAPRTGTGPGNLVNLVIRRVRMQGFIALDYYDRMDEALAQLAVWALEGNFAFRNDIQEGFEEIPAAFMRLFEGKNQGKQLLRISEPELH